MTDPLTAMARPFRGKSMPLPDSWPEMVKSAVIHAISIARFVAIQVRGPRHEAQLARVYQRADSTQFTEILAWQQRAAEIKDALMRRIKDGGAFRYTAIERLSILELKAARGLSIAQTAKIFILANSTIVRWMKRLEQNGAHALLQMDEPVNRFPDLVRGLVRRIRVLFPWMGKVRIANILARCGLHLAATTIGRILKEPLSGKDDPESKDVSGGCNGGESRNPACDSPSPAGAGKNNSKYNSLDEDGGDSAIGVEADGNDTGKTERPAKTAETAAGEAEAKVKELGEEGQGGGDEEASGTEPRIFSRHPNHTWHIDFTAVPTALGGFWCSWMPFALPQRWPFCWWLAIVQDHYSRKALGAAAFRKEPTGQETVGFLERVVRLTGRAPKYAITDKGAQFWKCGAYAEWCSRHNVRPRFGKVGKHGSIAVIERFIRTVKDEATRKIPMPFLKGKFLSEIKAHFYWYNHFRPHMTLGGATPQERYSGRTPVQKLFRYEPRPRYPRASRCASPQAPPLGPCGTRFELRVTYVRGRKHLPIVELRRVA